VEVSAFEGSWLDAIRFDGVEYWNINSSTPMFHILSENPLPSDWRYREDLIWLKKGSDEYGQEWKVRLEVQQRADKALREKFGPKKSKH
jgi:hypothetical protein